MDKRDVADFELGHPGTSPPAPAASQPGTSQQPGASLILSVFPGADLLGRGFELEGFCVVRGPDLLWGAHVQTFHCRRRWFAGMIAGSPCQDYSAARRSEPTGEGDECLFEYLRIVTEGQPEWFLLENVPRVPDVVVAGYTVQRIDLTARECGLSQRRLRHFQFGYRSGPPLIVVRPGAQPRVLQPAAMAGEGNNPRRSFADFCELQGLPRDFDLPGLSRSLKYRMVGNGVPIPMARLLASAIRQRVIKVCVCGCGRPVDSSRSTATAACRKRMQRSREGTRRRVTLPG